MASALPAPPMPDSLIHPDQWVAMAFGLITTMQVCLVLLVIIEMYNLTPFYLLTSVCAAFHQGIFWLLLAMLIPAHYNWYGGISPHGRRLVSLLFSLEAFLFSVDLALFSWLALVYDPFTWYGIVHIMIDVFSLYGLTLPICSHVKWPTWHQKSCPSFIFEALVLTPISMQFHTIGFNFFYEWVDIIGLILMLASYASGTSTEDVDFYFRCGLYGILTVEIVVWVLPACYLIYCGELDQDGRVDWRSIIKLLTVVDAVTDIPEIVLIIYFKAFQGSVIVAVTLVLSICMVVKSLLCVPIFNNAIDCRLFNEQPAAQLQNTTIGAIIQRNQP